MTVRLAIALVVALVPAVATAASKPSSSKPSTKWMAHCAANLKGEGSSAKSVRVYCACIHDLDDEAEMLKLSQTEIERSWPPAHRQCHKKAGWR